MLHGLMALKSSEFSENENFDRIREIVRIAFEVARNNKEFLTSDQRNIVAKELEGEQEDSEAEEETQLKETSVCSVSSYNKETRDYCETTDFDETTEIESSQESPDEITIEQPEEVDYLNELRKLFLKFEDSIRGLQGLESAQKNRFNK
jgi:hypothetical protein